MMMSGIAFQQVAYCQVRQDLFFGGAGGDTVACEIRSLGSVVSFPLGQEKERKKERRGFGRVRQTDKEKGAAKCDSVKRTREMTEKATKERRSASQIEIAAGLLRCCGRWYHPSYWPVWPALIRVSVGS